MKLYPLVRKVLKLLSSADCIGVVADIDADGVSGAATLCEAFGVTEDDVWFPSGGFYGVPKDALRDMLEEYDVIVAVDLTPPPVPGAEDRVVVIDHHPTDSHYPMTVNPYEIPALPTRTSASALVGMLAHRTGGLNRPWVPLIGAAGDGMEEGAVYETLASMTDPGYLVRGAGRNLTPLQDAAATVNAARRVKYDVGAREALKVLMSTDSPYDVTESHLQRYRKRVRKHRATWSSEAERTAHVVEGIGYAEIHTEVDVEGLVARDLVDRLNLRCSVVVNLARKPCGLYKASGRSRSFPVNELMVEMARWLEGSRAGGHPNAAALHFSGGDPREAFNRALDLLRP
ncbi:DHH family phosphoesterase [Methanopyrus sp.]